MAGKHKKHGPGDSEATIGELMFARAVIEEKNELIDRRDHEIRGLATELRRARDEVEELRSAVQALTSGRESDGVETGRQDEVIADVVRLVADWSDLYGAAPNELATRVLALLEEKHGLEAIVEVPDTIDPELHQVVSVDHTASGKAGIEVLAPGYALGDRVIRPALVKVVLGLRSDQTTALSPHQGAWRQGE